MAYPYFSALHPYIVSAWRSPSQEGSAGPRHASMASLVSDSPCSRAHGERAACSLLHSGRDRPARNGLGLVDLAAEQREGKWRHPHQPLTGSTCTFFFNFYFWKDKLLKSKTNEITWDQDTKTEIQCRKKDRAGSQSMRNTENISQTHKKLTL